VAGDIATTDNERMTYSRGKQQSMLFVNISIKFQFGNM